MSTVKAIAALPATQAKASSASHLLSPLLTQEQAAPILGLKPKTLAKDRCTREIGVPFVKIGKSARYRVADLEKFIADRVVV